MMCVGIATKSAKPCAKASLRSTDRMLRICGLTNAASAPAVRCRVGMRAPRLTAGRLYSHQHTRDTCIAVSSSAFGDQDWNDGRQYAVVNCCLRAWFIGAEQSQSDCAYSLQKSPVRRPEEIRAMTVSRARR